jgi:hypothetical protein
MLSPEILEILGNEWVQPRRDNNGKETWGYELKPGAPNDVIAAFDDFLEASAAEARLQGWNTEEVKEVKKWNPKLN